MSKQRIDAEGVPEPGPGTYTQAFLVERTVYISGQTATLSGGTVATAGDAGAQATQAFENIRRLLAAAGGTMDEVVKLTIYLTDMSMRAPVSEARRAFFSGDFPCSTLLEVSALAHPDFCVEIEAIAVLA